MASNQERSCAKKFLSRTPLLKIYFKKREHWMRQELKLEIGQQRYELILDEDSVTISKSEGVEPMGELGEVLIYFEQYDVIAEAVKKHRAALKKELAKGVKK